MSRPCTVCGRADQDEIDDALRRGESNRSIARRCAGTSKDSIARHAAHAITAPTPGPPPAPPEGSAPPAALGAPPERTAPRPPAGAPPPAPAPPSPERDEPPPAPQDGAQEPRTREERVRFVMGLMAANRWETGKTGRELALAWGLSPGTLDHVAAEASRRVKAVGEAEYVRTRLAAALDEGLGHALNMIRPRLVSKGELLVEEPGDPRALSGLAQLVKTYGELGGVARPSAAPDKPESPPVFRVDLASPERPEPPSLCPSSGSSSPPGGDPAPG